MNKEPIKKVAKQLGRLGHQYYANCTCKKSMVVATLNATETKDFLAGNFKPKPIECVKCHRIIQLTQPKDAKKEKGTNN